jgi:hypothetical protein
MAWWSTETGTLIGAIGGGGLGALCGLQGALAGTLAQRGRAKGLVLGLHGTLLALGILALGGGLVALLAGQPHHVAYPLLLVGGILTLVMGPLLPVVLKRYREAEST